jgi:hypothetical protein
MCRNPDAAFPDAMLTVDPVPTRVSSPATGTVPNDHAVGVNQSPFPSTQKFCVPGVASAGAAETAATAAAKRTCRPARERGLTQPRRVDCIVLSSPKDFCGAELDVTGNTLCRAQGYRYTGAHVKKNLVFIFTAVY